ncbi:hypothetical protein BSLG_007545 [Batrachochytrium salamandrivorans]|nr:hypothetical protein BSLG_007545 [Batrachochytrium salamandrivorans]
MPPSTEQQVLSGFVFTVKRKRNDEQVQSTTQTVVLEKQKEYPEGVQVKRLHNGETCVDMTLPILATDTPKIIKNKEFREGGGRRRRSSMGMRGKRVSSFNSNTFGMPHETIASEEYYRLLDAEQSDPVRMRQLLVWCAHKAMNDIPNRLSNGSASTDLLVREIQTEIISALHQRKINISWYQRPVDSSEVSNDSSSQSKSGKLPHPANLDHASNIALFHKQQEAYKQEEEHWKLVISRHNKEHEILKAADAQNAIISYNISDILPFLTPRYESVVKSKLSNELADFSREMSSDMLLNVHHLQDTVHRCQIASESLGESCESTYARMLRAFELQDVQEGKSVDPVDLLKLFSQASTASVPILPNAALAPANTAPTI